MKNKKFFFILIIIAILLLFLQEIASSVVYNDGICTRCGGHYVYQQAVGHRHETSYIYQCDKCGRIIEINSFH